LRKKKEKKRSSTGGDKSKKRGRPKGRQNEVKTEPDTPAHRTFKILLKKVFGILIKIRAYEQKFCSKTLDFILY
ncbi:MAG: hypothetical protein RML94_13225, partial [Bacteroidia bacterium]|nr:hypothetical protein [Bacteroidia bacterium]